MSSDLRYLLSGNSGSLSRSRSQIPLSISTHLPPIPTSLQRSPTLALTEARKSRPLGFRNLGNSCYQNSVFQAVLALEPFAEALRLAGAGAPGGGQLGPRLEELLREREGAGELPVQDGRRVREVLRHRMWRGREQQDALEFYLAMIDQLSEEHKPQFSFSRGSLLTRTRCGHCGTESSQKDAFVCVPLPIDGTASLEEALRQFQREEALEGANAYACDKCKRKTEATKNVEFQELPEILVFALKRFRWSNLGKCEKNQKLVKFPLHNLVVACVGNSLGRKYDLAGTVHHKGDSTDSGHYTAHVKRDAKWFLCDDSHVAEVAGDVPAALVAADTYLLFYAASGRPALAAAPAKTLLLNHNHRQFYSFFCS
jgi:ubiquitin C-terminal hydrolase